VQVKQLTRENTEDEESYFIRCDCYGHLLNVMIFKEDIGDEFGFVYLTSYDQDTRLGWRNRLKAIWQLLRHGNGGGRDIVFQRDVAIQLGQKIVDLGEKLKGPKEETP